MNSKNPYIYRKILINLNDQFDSIDDEIFLYQTVSIICYRYLSENTGNNFNKPLKMEVTFNSMEDVEIFAKKMKEEHKNKLGHILELPFTFKEIYEKCENNEFNLKELQISLEAINNSKLESLNNIFSLKTIPEMLNDYGEKETTKLFKTIIELVGSQNKDELTDIFDFIINRGLGGVYYRLQQDTKNVNSFIRKIIDENNVEKSLDILDYNCSNGGLLYDLLTKNNNANLYGFTDNIIDYNLSRMNLIIHGINLKKINVIYNKNPLEILESKNIKFNNIIYTPQNMGPTWIQRLKLYYDELNEINEEYDKLNGKNENNLFLKTKIRENSYKRSRRKIFDENLNKIDFKNILKLIEYLKNNGSLFTVSSEKLLYLRSSLNERKFLVNNNYLDSIITSPINMMRVYRDQVIMIFKKSRNRKDILYINTKKLEDQKALNEAYNIYASRQEINKISHRASIGEIEENEFNLNVPRYLDTFDKKPVKLESVMEEINNNDKKLDNINHQIEDLCKKLDVELNF